MRRGDSCCFNLQGAKRRAGQPSGAFGGRSDFFEDTMPLLRRRSSSDATEPKAAPEAVQALPAEEEPLIYTLRIALNLQMRESSTETYTHAGPVCDSIENVLAHGFKSKQFFVFTVRHCERAPRAATRRAQAPRARTDPHAGAPVVAGRGLSQAPRL